jgi:hypothetical protein
VVVVVVACSKHFRNSSNPDASDALRGALRYYFGQPMHQPQNGAGMLLILCSCWLIGDTFGGPLSLTGPRLASLRTYTREDDNVRDFRREGDGASGVHFSLPMTMARICGLLAQKVSCGCGVRARGGCRGMGSKHVTNAMCRHRRRQSETAHPPTRQQKNDVEFRLR